MQATPQGLTKRYTPAAMLRDVWESALTEVIDASPVASPLLARFPAVLVMAFPYPTPSPRSGSAVVNG